MVLKIAIIGAGVNGLSCGVQLAKYYKNLAEITIISEVFSPHTTGDGSAGLWGPYLIGSTKSEKIIEWSKITHDFFEELWLSDDSGIAGICLIPAIRVSSSNDDIMEDFWKDIVYGWRRLTKYELEKLSNETGNKFVQGMQFMTFTAEPIKLLPYLTEIFKKFNGKLIEGKIENFNDFVKNSNYDVIINCTGLGSKTLIGDKNVHAIRGQVARVQAPWMYYTYLDEASNGNYIIPNTESVVIGGTHQMEDYNTIPDEGDKKFILNGCKQIVPALENASFLFDWVGLRPGRTEVRIEKVITDDGKIIIHNYGHGGSGVTICWGCATNVLELLKPKSNL
ncbi:D-aspartate oxidase [Condylostylus longicornis]|uniref:D-aspartate oxidase n=1 Tax=Condylostylus longicornis TaxID=2530218 RepID=UPI00244E3648|nr:D-aspartate oxidase [Condylostylus longicornis]